MIENFRSDLDAHSIRWEVVSIDADKKKDTNNYEPIVSIF